MTTPNAPTQRAPRHFIHLDDLSRSELERLLQRASDLRRMHARRELHQPLTGRTLAMVFDQNSTRTRVAFEAGMAQLGGHALFLSAGSTQIGRGEPVQDTARVLSEMVDAVMIRTPDQAMVDAFAAASAVPVINAMTNDQHPCQLLADLQTFRELRGDISGRTVAFLGDGFNMAHSFMDAASLFDFTLNLACPQGFEPDPARVERHSANVNLLADPNEAVEGAHLVVTDVWSSMAHESETDTETAQRMATFQPYQVTTELLDRADPEVLFMHCLPAHRGEEVTAAVMDDPRSVVIHEAGNRLHSQKALLEFLILGN